MARFKLSSSSLGVLAGQRSETDKEIIIPGISVITEGPVVSHFVTIGEGAQAKQFQVMADEGTLSSIIAGAQKYANGVKVKAGHDGTIKDIIGRLTDFAMDKTKDGKNRVSASLHLFKSSPLFAEVLNLIDTIADTIGFSVIADGPAIRIGDYFFPRFTELFSTDLVTEASANPTGIFETKVDNMQKDQGAGNTMTPEEIGTHCMSAMKPHIDAIHGRLTALEQAHQAVKTKMDAGAPINPTDEEAMYSRFTAKLSKGTLKDDVTAMVTTALQDTAKTIHALGLTLGTGPASSIDKGAPAGGKKVEDMTFNEILAFEFARKENAEMLAKPGGRFELVHKLTNLHKAKHQAQLAERVDNKFVGIRVPAAA